jgi:hypothetical protein
VDLCPLIEQKMPKKWGLGAVWVTVENKEKLGNGGDLTVDGGWWRWRSACDGVLVVVGMIGGGRVWI